MTKTKQDETHKCKLDELYIRKGTIADIPYIRVYGDCKCEESKEEALITFHENEYVDYELAFEAWLEGIAPYMIRNKVRIKDLR